MLNPEENQAYIPPLAEVASAYGDILEYNYKHTGVGASIANLMAADDDVGGGSDDKWHAGVERRVVEGDATAEMQNMFHSGTFELIGIKVDSILPGSIVGGSMRASSAALKPRLVNTELYTDFLKTLHKDEVQAQIPNFALQADVIGSLSKTVRVCFGRLPEDLTEEQRAQISEAGAEALRAFTTIEPEYERLGLDSPAIYQHALVQESSGSLDDAWQLQQDAKKYMNSYAHMRRYVEYWGRNVLPEYLEVGQELSAREQIKYFDGGHDKLVTDVDYILSLQMDDRTRGFGAEVAHAKAQSLTMTLKVMDDDPSAWFASKSNRKLVAEQLARLQPYLQPV